MLFQDHQLHSGKRTIAVTVVAQKKDSLKAVIIGPAMGVKRKFYQAIAEYLYDKGYSCILVDYHGMFADGSSAEPSDIASFGKIDLDVVIDYCTRTLRLTEIYFLGHSISGQVLPLAENASTLKAVYLVASQCVDANHWTGKSSAAVTVFWNLLIPATTRLLGHLPSWAYGGKHHLSSSVARDWARLAKTKGGLAEDNPHNKSRYDSFAAPVKFVSIAGDDLLAPQKSVVHLYEQYGSKHKQLLHLSKKSPNGKPLDHFSFFKKQNSDLWDDVREWFEV